MKKVDTINYIINKKDFFPEETANFLKNEISYSSYFGSNNKIKLKNPNISLLFSFFFGWLGLDRFYLRERNLGILKLLTIGGFGMWWIADLLTVKKRTRYYNFWNMIKKI